jgi:hypothetical protein
VDRREQCTKYGKEPLSVKVEYVRKGREETVIGKGLTASSSPPYQ